MPSLRTKQIHRGISEGSVFVPASRDNLLSSMTIANPKRYWQPSLPFLRETLEDISTYEKLPASDPQAMPSSSFGWIRSRTSIAGGLLSAYPTAIRHPPCPTEDSAGLRLLRRSFAYAWIPLSRRTYFIAASIPYSYWVVYSNGRIESLSAFILS